ncbi:hypothetical protein RvY_04617 [Ramazzottius varieornatus]|uniref:Uncharacterized protein n=1 Tax=Ramazzottius varieornatus TaxID=947166 RepID=A0A1D1UVJ6_RAMVA|nr:hypothetical protein RvY_04617 [Ramazzottius varieornatus]
MVVRDGSIDVRFYGTCLHRGILLYNWIEGIRRHTHFFCRLEKAAIISPSLSHYSRTMAKSYVLSLVLAVLTAVLFVYGQAVPLKGKRNGRNGNGYGLGGVNLSLADNHSDQWMSLSDDLKELLLQAYYTAGIPTESELQICNGTEECPAKFRCDDTWKFCVKKDSPHFPPTDGSCSQDTDCKPMYRCTDRKCLLTGPMTCRSQADCLTVRGVEFECVDIPEKIPGKRCWRKCESVHSCMECEVQFVASNTTSTDTDVVVSTCRVPPPFRLTIQCRNGFCFRTQRVDVSPKAAD